MKLLLYCTKTKPTLYNVLGKFITTKYMGKDFKQDGITHPELNGKIVAECDFEVEEIFGISRGTNQPDKYDFKWEDRILKGACLTNEQMNDYIPNYAIHIKNLHIFDEPKELSEYYSKAKKMNTLDGYDWVCESIDRAPQNMMYAYDGGGNKYIVISIQSQWMCLILNRIKDVEVRKKVLKEMI